jgi:hypothetical protein
MTDRLIVLALGKAALLALFMGGGASLAHAQNINFASLSCDNGCSAYWGGDGYGVIHAGIYADCDNGLTDLFTEGYVWMYQSSAYYSSSVYSYVNYPSGLETDTSAYDTYDGNSGGASATVDCYGNSSGAQYYSDDPYFDEDINASEGIV